MKPLSAVGHRLSARGPARCAAVLFVVLSTPLWAQMPDLRQMSGQPLPSPDLPAGSVSVRVVRGSMSQNIAGQDVELRAGGAGETLVRTIKTDEAGRAVFTGIPTNTSYQAVARVAGESLVSQTFTLPTTGGVRLLLVAGLSSAASSAPPVPAAPGTIALGSQSRIVVELAEESVEVFALLDLVNPLAGPVSLATPLVFELPEGSTNGTILQESSNLAKVEGGKIVVAGPLAAGTTTLQFAYRIPSSTGTAEVKQILPMTAPHGTVIVRKQGPLQVTLNGEQNRRDVTLEGRTYLVLTRGALPAGSSLEVTLTGLPARARWPLYAALGLSALVVAAGVFWAATAGHDANAERARLQAVRTRLFGDLVSLERRRRSKAAADPAVTEQRDALVAEIAELDAAIEALVPPPAATAATAQEAHPAPSSALQ